MVIEKFVEAKVQHLRMKCDQCNVEFVRNKNVRMLMSRPRQYCSSGCAASALRKGGIADASRKKTCIEKYGTSYFIITPQILAQNAERSHTPEAEARRRAAIRESLKNTTIQLRRGLFLTRSKAEIKFFDALAGALGYPLETQVYINGWWIDAWSPVHDVWLQFDGVYWHSKPNAVLRDRAQDLWFADQGKRLIRITDVEARNARSVEDLALKITNPVGSS
jgi:hypothetical protein